MTCSARSSCFRLAFLLAAAASPHAFGFDYSAQIAQQQRDAAQRSAQMQNDQRMADMRRSNDLAQMRASNLRNDQMQEELRKSRAKVLGLDRAVTGPPVFTPALPPVALPATARDTQAPALAAGPAFPMHSVWADFPGQRVFAFQNDGTFKLLYPQNNQLMKLVGRYEVDGRTVRLMAANKVETLNWGVGSVPDLNGRAVARLHLSNATSGFAWVACPACPN